MKRLIATVLLSLFFISILSAAPVDEQTARLAATRWMLLSANGESTDHTVDAVYTMSSDGLTACYIINLLPSGMVVVSADDIAAPVIMYSPDGQYDGSTLPPALEHMLEAVMQDIATAVRNGEAQTSRIADLWSKLLEDEENMVAYFGGGASVSAVSPLLSTTWNQTFPYNKDCPATTTGGSGGYVYTGCVATAMAQIMKYWDFPTTGVSSHSYTHSTYGLQSANFGNTTYNWSAMPNSVSGSSSTAAKNAVATLMYHCGVSVEMDYGPSGSASSIYYSYQVMPVFFRYKNSISYKSRSSYSASAWLSLMTAELNNGRPILYRGSNQSGTSGHAFIVDGFTGSDYFHMNFGWGGYLDGYFYLNDITPGTNTFNYMQAMVVGIEPDASPPPTLASPADLSTNQCTAATLAWNSASGASSYRLQVSTDQSFSSTVYDNASLTGNSTQVSGLAGGTTYYWRMNATGTAGTSTWTSPWSFTTVQAVISAGGPTAFCDGGSVQLSTPGVPAASYQWARGGVPVQGGNLSSLTAMTSGDYTVTVTVNGCPNVSSPMTVTVYSLPTAEILPPLSTEICDGGSTLLVAQQAPAYNYQWVKDGQDISGAVTPSFSATESGVYALRVSANGCEAMSDTLSILVYPADPTDLIWTGGIDSDWLTPGNWNNPCAVPSAGDNVTIPSGCTPPASIPSCTLQNLTINNASGTALSGNVMITGMLSLVNGKLSLGSSDLTIGATGEIIGGSVSSHIVTGGMGQLVQKDIGSNGRYRQVLFPLGNDAGEYVPCHMLNTALKNDFSMRAQSEVLDGGHIGNPITQGVVDNSWIISAGSGSTNLSLTFAWSASAELSGFDRTQSFASSNDNAQSWIALQTPGPAQGSGPYTLSVGSVMTLSSLGTPFGIGSSGTLYPVELLSFTAELLPQGVQLEWETAREVNNHGFEVQRRTGDADIWKVMTFIPASFAPGDGFTYRWLDTNPGAGEIMYRLRQMDVDGSSEYSPVLSVNGGTAAATTLSEISPQPIQRGSEGRVAVRSALSQNIRIVIFDMLGRPLHTVFEGMMNAGQSRTLLLPSSGLRAGTYFLHLQSKHAGILRRFTILQ
jgi:hypothetical protein